MRFVYFHKDFPMLACVYHPIDDFQVVEDDEAEKLIASGVWFDSPLKAKQYRERVEEEIRNESSDEIPKTRKKRVSK
jgi:hypothetical protein